MTDIATLGLAIDSSQAASASSNLDSMAAASMRAESTTKRAEAASTKLAAANKIASVNTASLAAQFQDVAVSLQAGAGPMQVALQQGTQIAMAFGNAGAAGAARGLGAAFLSLISPVSLLSVGIVALAGYAIQWATSSASETDKATEALKRHDDVLKIIKERYPQIKVESDKYAESISRLGLVEQRNADVLKASSDAATAALVARAQQVNSLVSAGGSIRTRIGSPEDIKAFQDLQTATQDFLRSVAAGNPQVIRFAEAIAQVSRESGNPEVRSIAGDLSDAAEGAAKAAHNVGSTEGAIKALNGQITEALPDVKAYAEALASLSGPLQRQLTVLEDINRQRAIAMKNASSIGEQEDAEAVYQLRLKQLETEKKLVELYGSGGVPTPPTKPNRESIVYSTDTKAARDADRDKQNYDRLVASANARVASLQAEQSALGLTSQEALKLQYSQDLLNRAQVSGLKLTPEQTKDLKALAAQMAATDDANRKMTEAWDDAKGAAKGFVSDFVSGLRNGEKAWKSFGDAANGVLDKIINKVEDQLINTLFMNSSSGGAGLGGFLSSLFKFNALGGVYGSGGAMAFANGGAFTNSIVSKPTLFPFANGTGLMGEKGPEAIMPLARDSAGRLGVKSSGGGGVSVAMGDMVMNVSGSIDQSTLPIVKAMMDDTRKQIMRDLPSAVRDAQARGKI